MCSILISYERRWQQLAMAKTTNFTLLAPLENIQAYQYGGMIYSYIVYEVTPCDVSITVNTSS